jgi:hypothetical protein
MNNVVDRGILLTCFAVLNVTIKLIMLDSKLI